MWVKETVKMFLLVLYESSICFWKRLSLFYVRCDAVIHTYFVCHFQASYLNSQHFFSLYKSFIKKVKPLWRHLKGTTDESNLHIPVIHWLDPYILFFFSLTHIPINTNNDLGHITPLSSLISFVMSRCWQISENLCMHNIP